jgi:hypothetical protein
LPGLWRFPHAASTLRQSRASLPGNLPLCAAVTRCAGSSPVPTAEHGPQLYSQVHCLRIIRAGKASGRHASSVLARSFEPFRGATPGPRFLLFRSESREGVSKSCRRRASDGVDQLLLAGHEFHADPLGAVASRALGRCWRQGGDGMGRRTTIRRSLPWDVQSSLPSWFLAQAHSMAAPRRLGRAGGMGCHRLTSFAGNMG